MSVKKSFFTGALFLVPIWVLTVWNPYFGLAAILMMLSFVVYGAIIMQDREKEDKKNEYPLR